MPLIPPVILRHLLSSSVRRQGLMNYVSEFLLSGRPDSFSINFSLVPESTEVHATLQMQCTVDLQTALQLERVLKRVVDGWGQNSQNIPAT